MGRATGPLSRFRYADYRLDLISTAEAANGGLRTEEEDSSPGV